MFSLEKAAKNIFLKSIRYCQTTQGALPMAIWDEQPHDMIIGGYGDQGLEHINKDVKKYTSTRIVGAIKHNPQERTHITSPNIHWDGSKTINQLN